MMMNPPSVVPGARQGEKCVKTAHIEGKLMNTLPGQTLIHIQSHTMEHVGTAHRTKQHQRSDAQ